MSNESYIFQQIKEKDALNLATNVVGPAFGLYNSSDAIHKYLFPNQKCRLRAAIKRAYLRLKLDAAKNNVFGILNKTTNECITTATYKAPDDNDITAFFFAHIGFLVLLPLRSDVYALFRKTNFFIRNVKFEEMLKVVTDFHEITNIATKPETQGKGFGTKIIQQMHNLIDKKSDNLPIALFCGNTKLYEKNGYICWNKIYIDDIPNNGKFIMNAMIYHKDKKELNKLVDKLKENNCYHCFDLNKKANKTWDAFQTKKECIIACFIFPVCYFWMFICFILRKLNVGRWDV